MMNCFFPKFCISFLALITILAAEPVFADKLRDNLLKLTQTHKRMLAANADVKAAMENLEVTWGEWYPNVTLTANIGLEKQNKPSGSDDTNMTPQNYETSITQKVWDFGSTNASIRSSRLTIKQAMDTRESTKQTLLLEGLTAYLNIIRSNKLLEFASSSVDNIKRQAELEDAKVQRGSGFSTDVLQAKTQLAGAEARLIQSQGALKTAINRYRAVYGEIPRDIEKMTNPRLPLELLPKSLEAAIRTAVVENPQLRAARTGASVAREAVIKTRIDGFLPSFDLTAESKFKEDSGGTANKQQDQSLKLEATYDFNMGLTAVNTLRASQQGHISTVNRFGDTRDQIEEQVRNAWDNLQTTQANAGRLHNQANIAAEFLELARRERQLGNRSLIDVLSGETALINASSDAASADTDVAIAVFSLLNAMGQLDSTIVD
ncbi:MAG: outer membrane efflux protein [Magnetovibrio sp.]|nr:outer membrane efflux protein [Magnetovibrio sp.]